MLTCINLEEQIEKQLESKEDYIIFNNILSQIAEENDLELKDLKSILYQNNSKFYETSGYIDGRRISIQNLVLTFKKLIKKIFKQLETSIDYKLTYDEKIKILKYIEYNMRINNELL